MNKILTIILICACSFFYTEMNAQCGTTVNSGVCYTSTGALVQIAVDVCPDNATDIAEITFTAGSIESCCDEIVVYSGAAGSGTGGSEIYNQSRGATDLAGLTVTGDTAGECLHIYINADGSVDCASGAGVPASFDISCIAPPPPEGCLNPAVVTPICTDQPVTFSAGTNQTAAQTANPAVNYGCITDARNPAWYYLEINANGTLSFDITNSNNLDVDWAAWGPFADLAEINTDCASGAAPFDAPVDCDYTTNPSGVIDLGTVTAGEVYAVLVTNFSNTATDVSMATTAASTATTDCSILPPDGYWINSTAPAAGSWGTCPYPVITDASGTMYDQFGPSSPTPAGQSQVVTVCPDGAATVDLTINYNMQDPLGLGDELVAIFDDKSRNDGLNEIANLSGTGTQSYTTTGPCFTILYQPTGGAGFQIDWSINTAGAGTTFVQGDMCEDPFLITSLNTPVTMSAVGATSGPVYNAGAIVAGTGCDPDLIGDGCTTTVENTIYAKFTSCAAGGSATLTLNPTTCNSTGQTPQMFLYTGTCGSHTFTDCVNSLSAGGTPTLTATLAANTEYTIVVDGFRGIECDFTIDVTGCIETAAVTCADCLETACNSGNPIYTNFGVSEANFGGNCWSGAGATETTGTVITADVAGTNTVCTDFDVSSFANFIGFDNCISYIDDDASGDLAAPAFTTSWTMYQEVGGACVALLPTNTNVYGQFEFDNNVTAGTTPGDLGSFDPTLPITYCYTYTSDGSGAANDDDVQGNTPVAYGCTAISTITAGTPSACNPADNTYTVDVTVTIPNMPAAGGTTDDTEVDINGQKFTMTGTTETFTLTGLISNGASVDLTAFMSVSTGCTTTSSAAFTAPAACSVTCTPNAGTISAP